MERSSSGSLARWLAMFAAVAVVSSCGLIWYLQSRPVGYYEQWAQRNAGYLQLVRPQENRPKAINEMFNVLVKSARDAQLRYDPATYDVYSLPLYEYTLSADLLAALPYFKELTRLDLRASNLDDKLMEQVGKLTGLEELWINETDVTDIGISHLSGLTGLKYLHVDDTGISDVGFVELAKLPSLVLLVVSSDLTDSKGVAYLRDHRKNVEIRFVTK